MNKTDLLKKSSYHYELPDDLIAQYPLADRSGSRLLKIDKKNQTISHDYFKNIIDFFKPGDVLVMNASKVIPARLIGYKSTGSRIEVFMLNPVEPSIWVCLVKPGRKVKLNSVIHFSENFYGKVIDYAEEGARKIQFFIKNHEDGLFTHSLLMDEIKKVGKIPLPPYIHRESELSDQENYQTVYAKEEGSVAAPTAGLHFTNNLLNQLQAKGVILTEVILHVGLGTFRPVQTDDILNHKMHSEYCTISSETAQIINTAKLENRRVIAVGTTSVRTLESFATHHILNHGSKWTDIFIYPGKKIQIADALITNFHMPESTLMMLVSAFAGYELIMNAYTQAVKEKYRFFSYGDACLIY